MALKVIHDYGISLCIEVLYFLFVFSNSYNRFEYWNFFTLEDPSVSIVNDQVVHIHTFIR